MEPYTSMTSSLTNLKTGKRPITVMRHASTKS